MAEKTITGENFEQAVVQSELPVLLDFWAPWCPPCRALSPTLHKLAQEHEGSVTVGTVNIDEEPELAARFRVSSVPTLLLLKKGVPINRSVGLQSAAQLNALLD